VAVTYANQWTGTMILGSDYGMVCNGSTNDGPSLQDALNAVAAAASAFGPVIVQLPYGTETTPCVIGSTVTSSSSDFILQGAPGGTVLKAAANAWLPNLLKLSGSYVTVREITFDGNIANLGVGWRIAEYSSTGTYHTSTSYSATTSSGGGDDVVYSCTGGSGTDNCTSPTSVQIYACISSSCSTNAPPNATYWAQIYTTTAAAVLAAPGNAGELVTTSGDHYRFEHLELTGSDFGLYMLAYYANLTDAVVDGLWCHDFFVQYEGNNTVGTCVVVQSTLTGSGPPYAGYYGMGIRVVNGHFENIYVPAATTATSCPGPATCPMGPGATAAIAVAGDNSVIANNYFKNVIQTGGGVVVTSGGSLGSVSIGWSETGNTFVRSLAVGASPFNYDKTEAIEAECTQCSFTGNTGYGYESGIGVTGVSSGSTPHAADYDSLTGNSFYGSGTATAAFSNACFQFNSGSATYPPSNNMVSGNNCANFYYGVADNTGLNITLNGNQFNGITTLLDLLNTTSVFGNDILGYVQYGTPTFTKGTNVTSAACATGFTCANQRGMITVVGGTNTSNPLVTINFSATLGAAPGLCSATQQSGTTSTYLDIGAGTPSTTGVAVNTSAGASGDTVNIAYTCQM
jgi:hypothetical protein